MCAHSVREAHGGPGEGLNAGHIESPVPDTLPLQQQLVLGAGDRQGELVRGYQVDMASSDSCDKYIQADCQVMLLIQGVIVKHCS